MLPRLPSCCTNSASARPCAVAIPIALAYIRAAENLMVLTVPLEEVVAQDRLKEIPGVGDAIADIVTKLHQEGGHPALDAMRKEIPAGALEMLNVPGLRPDKVLKVYKELGISSVDELEKAAKEDRLRPVKVSARRCRARSCKESRSGAMGKGSATCIALQR
jgi:DNA polymerase (family X)